MKAKDQQPLLDITEMSTADILQEYNAITGNNTLRFSSRDAGVERLKKAREAAAQAAELLEVAKTTPKKPVNPARSVGVTKSWTDPDVRKKRALHQRVRVVMNDPKRDGAKFTADYESVPEAFRALDFYWPQHIIFRQRLKRELQAQWDMKGKKALFICIDADGKEIQPHNAGAKA